MKKALAILLAMLMVISVFAGCGAASSSSAVASSAASTAAEPVSITLWTYPIGNWKDSATVDGFIKAFNAEHPEVTVTVEYLD